eukprot:scaffold2263_cov391-Prasinococcus_capsulatus_cf.AAC.7
MFVGRGTLTTTRPTHTAPAARRRALGTAVVSSAESRLLLSDQQRAQRGLAPGPTLATTTVGGERSKQASKPINQPTIGIRIGVGGVGAAPRAL